MKAFVTFLPMHFSRSVTNSLTNREASSTRAATIYRTVMRVKLLKEEMLIDYKDKRWGWGRIIFNSASQQTNNNPIIFK